MSPPERLTPANSTLVVIDLQEKFAPAIDGWGEIIGKASVLARTASLLDWPVIVTEQYPKGLGATVSEVATALDGFAPLEKSCFSATDADGFDLAGRQNVVLCGVETHVCVQQTAMALRRSGIEVRVAVDATGSRRRADRDPALAAMALAGVLPTTVEAIGFELIGSAGVAGFREFQEMIK